MAVSRVPHFVVERLVARNACQDPHGCEMRGEPSGQFLRGNRLQDNSWKHAFKKGSRCLLGSQGNVDCEFLGSSQHNQRQVDLTLVMGSDHKVNNVLPKFGPGMAIPKARQSLDTKKRLLTLVEQLCQVKLFGDSAFQLEPLKLANQLPLRVQRFNIQARDHTFHSLQAQRAYIAYTGSIARAYTASFRESSIGKPVSPGEKRERSSRRLSLFSSWEMPEVCLL